MATRYSLFAERWSNCTACALHKERQNVVLARGTVPADICFVGEAPGKVEDSLALPFTGPAGHLLDQIVERACVSATYCPRCRAPFQNGEKFVSVCVNGHKFMGEGPHGVALRLAFTNLICCIPWDDGEDGKLAEPPDYAVQACASRLQEFLVIADPKLIVCVGRHASDYLTPGYRWSIKLHRPIPQCQIQHPAYLLRLNTIQRNLGIQRAIVTIQTAIRSYLGKNVARENV